MPNIREASRATRASEPAPGKRLQKGFGLLSASLLVYSASALSMAASAGLFVAAYEAHRRADPLQEALGTGGSAMAFVGSGLLAGCLGLLLAAFHQLQSGARAAGPESAHVLSMARGFFFGALILLVITGPTLLIASSYHTPAGTFEFGVVVSAVAALAF